MALVSQAPALHTAAERFRAFFTELGRTFVEREDLLTQIALALLSREHVLMTGPPGTAKSGIASAVLGRIVDERTGKASLFARQFTESTVQTDLVGPIDFKTLMQTGRTEHFTDEGMLGAVHAFLDEVLDGRDMLLRTTLNVLHERELKQGGKTTQGQIECALMTTNRYLAEVLESSRETLLAFVDRIAFLAFVPKGFHDPTSMSRVVRSQAGGEKPRPLTALLTIQDLDVLQDAASHVELGDAVISALCTLCAQLDAELALAAKHDPLFFPSRYLSTRTTVRMARLLKSICVYDAIMSDRPRTFEVIHEDLAMLRLSLLLSGPDAAHIGTLLDRESDPRERRQLSILRSEREIFERVLARLPKPKPAHQDPHKQEVEQLQREVTTALRRAESEQAPPSELLQTAAQLAVVSDRGGTTAASANALLEQTLARLTKRALAAGTTAGAGPEQEPDALIHELAELADGLERASGTTRPVARWLRGRALQLLVDTAILAGTRVGAALEARTSVPNASELATEWADERAKNVLARLEQLHERVGALRAAGADDAEGGQLAAALKTVEQQTEDELVEIWDAGFRQSVRSALERVGDDRLDMLLDALAPALNGIDHTGARLGKLSGATATLKTRVAAPRIEPLVQSAFARVATHDRLDLIQQVRALVEQLRTSGLHAVLSKNHLLRFAIEALVRGESARTRTPHEPTPSLDAYRALRMADERISLAYTTIELALHVHGDRLGVTGTDTLVGSVPSFVGTLPAELRQHVVQLDRTRIERALTLLEAWWASLARELEASTESDIGYEASLVRLADSQFFHVTRDEGALLRFALEIRVLGEVFPEADLSDLRARIDELERASSTWLRETRKHAAEAAWSTVLTS